MLISPIKMIKIVLLYSSCHNIIVDNLLDYVRLQISINGNEIAARICIVRLQWATDDDLFLLIKTIAKHGRHKSFAHQTACC